MQGAANLLIRRPLLGFIPAAFQVNGLLCKMLTPQFRYLCSTGLTGISMRS